jgi:hypothetical protein
MPRCGDCKHYQTGMIDDPGMCTALWNLVRSNDGCSHFERRLTMEKQPTENITIPVWRYDLLVKAETMLELAKQIHRNSDEYEAKKNLMIVFDADEEPCETI